LIPKVAHFIWLGPELLWVHRLALVSAAKHGGFERVLLHHDGTLDARALEGLAATPGVELAVLDAPGLVEAAGGSALVECYRELTTPAARVNVLRMALLAERGGVYLDTDTVTLRSFAPLLERGGVFCGTERLVFPGVQSSWLARLHPAALARMAARDAFRRLPGGYAGFRAVERFYPTAVNNAVLGAEPGHALVRELVARAVRLPTARRRVRYALGTHLLQAVVRDFGGADLAVLPPPVFYPLGPEISEHWFRERKAVELDSVIAPETLLVHWYASVRTRSYVSHLDLAFVRTHASTQLFAALARRALDE
jgi:glycosyl transferase-like sugar-binding protein